MQRLGVHAIVVVRLARCARAPCQSRASAPAFPRRSDSRISASVRTSRASTMSAIGNSTSAGFAFRRILAPQPRGLALDPEQDAAKPLAPLA